MVNVGRATVDVDAELDRSSIAVLGRRIENALGKAGDRAGARFANQFGILGGRLTVVLGGITAAAPLAASAISALSGAVVALSASLFNAIGASLSLVGVLGSLGQAMIVANIGFKNFGKAITADTPKKFNNAIQGMGSNLLATVKVVRSFSKEWRALTNSVQAAIFADTENQIRSLAETFLPLLQRQFTETGRIFNGVFDQFVRFTQTTLFVSKFSKALKVNNDILRNLGNAAVPLLDGLLNVFLALQPSSVRLSASIAELSERFQKATAGAAFAERVDAFMLRAANSAKLLGSFVGNLAGAFGNIFKAATPAGDSFLQTLVGITQRFQDFTASASGQNSIAIWAANGVAAMKDFGSIFRQFGEFFASISDPAILKAFTDVLSSMAGTLNTLAPLIQSFSVSIAKILSLLAPILGPALALAVAFNGLAFAASLVGAIIGTLVGPLGAIVKIGGALAKVVQLAAVAFRVLGAALLANPVVLIAVALIALGAALVIAYQKSETFRNIVNTAFATIKAVAVAAVGFVSAYVMFHFNLISTVISTTLNVAWTVVQFVFGSIRAYIMFQVNAVLLVVTTVFNAMRAVITAVLSGIVAAVRLYWNTVRTITSAVWSTIRSTVVSMVGAIRSAVVSGFSGIISFITGIPGEISSLAGRFLSAGKELGSSVIKGIQNGLKSVGGFASDIAGSIKDAINSTLHLPFTIKGPGPLPDFTIPAFATGVRNFQGGVALVGERGPELVDLPGGSNVHTASDTAGMLGGPVDLSQNTILALAAAILAGARQVSINVVEANNIATASGVDFR